MKVLVTDQDYRELRDRWIPISERELSWNEVIVQAWISKIEGNVLSGIISKDKPEVLFDVIPTIEKTEREIQADELEPESRKDTLWGDLKLQTKIINRKVAHEYEHLKKVEDSTTRAPINILIEIPLEEANKISIGGLYSFRVTKVLRMSVITLMVGGKVAETPNESFNDIRSFLIRRRVKNILMVLSPFVVLFVYGWSSK